MGWGEWREKRELQLRSTLSIPQCFTVVGLWSLSEPQAALQLLQSLTSLWEITALCRERRRRRKWLQRSTTCEMNVPFSPVDNVVLTSQTVFRWSSSNRTTLSCHAVVGLDLELLSLQGRCT